MEDTLKFEVEGPKWKGDYTIRDFHTYKGEPVKYANCNFIPAGCKQPCLSRFKHIEIEE